MSTATDSMIQRLTSLEVKNAAKEGVEESKDKILAIGGIGVGKTTQIHTLPGRKFCYFFDSSGLPSVRGNPSIDYVEFLPDAHEIDLSTKTLKKELGDKSIRDIEPNLYTRWYADLMARSEEKFFDKYNWICMDSYTTFESAVMNRVQFLNKRMGKQPEQADYAAVMNQVNHVYTVLTGSNCGIYCTAHIQHEKDTEEIGGERRTVGKAYGRLLMIGRNRIRIPLQFSTILAFECDSDEKAVKYIVQTRPSDKHPVVRHCIEGLNFIEDVTINFNSPLESQGLGRLLKRSRSKELQSTIKAIKE